MSMQVDASVFLRIPLGIQQQVFDKQKLLNPLGIVLRPIRDSKLNCRYYCQQLVLSDRAGD